MMGKRAMVNQMCRAIEGGHSVAAAYLGMSESKFRNRLYENKGIRFFSVDELLALQEFSGTTLVAEYFAEHANALVIAKPTADSDTVELHHMGLKTHIKRSVVDKLVLEAIANDGAIDEDEKKRILNAHDEHMATRTSEVMAAIQVYKKQKPARA